MVNIWSFLAKWAKLLLLRIDSKKPIKKEAVDSLVEVVLSFNEKRVVKCEETLLASHYKLDGLEEEIDGLKIKDMAKKAKARDKTIAQFEKSRQKSLSQPKKTAKKTKKMAAKSVKAVEPNNEITIEDNISAVEAMPPVTSVEQPQINN